MIRNFKDYKIYLEADLIANSVGRVNSLSDFVKKLLFPNLIWSFIKTLRKTEYLKNTSKRSFLKKIMFLYYYSKYRRLSLKLNFSIPLNVFGPGLSIPHYGTIVVNANSQIGKNCRIHACVNIGASGGNSNAPKIGDNVYIGPGVIIFGAINIADNITIAANSTVFKDYNSKNTTIAGTPAVIVKENTSTWLQKNRLFQLDNRH